jgi:hypothetical protein
MRSSPNGPTVSTSNAMAAHGLDPLPARRAAAAVCRIGSPLHATAAAPLWRVLSDEGAIWLLTPPRREGGRI